MNSALFSWVQNCLLYHWTHIRQLWGYVSWIAAKQLVKGPLMWFWESVVIGSCPKNSYQHKCWWKSTTLSDALSRKNAAGRPEKQCSWTSGLACEELFGWPPSMGLRTPTDLTRTFLSTSQGKYVLIRSWDCSQQVDVRTPGLVKMAQHLYVEATFRGGHH